MIGANDNIGLITAAAIAAIPATVGVLFTLRNGRKAKAINEKLETGNGKDAGPYLVEIREEQVRIALALIAEQQRNSERMAEDDRRRARQKFEREADRQLIRDHIAADEAFQARVFPDG